MDTLGTRTTLPIRKFDQVHDFLKYIHLLKQIDKYLIAYFRHGEYNIISVDYNPLAKEPCYLQAVKNLPVVARCTSQLLDTIVDRLPFELKNIHVIGFSLGAQTAGMISNYIKSGRFTRITGRLDNIQFYGVLMLGFL